MAFDYDAARADGYSDAEIADYLAKQNKFDISGARKAGYNDTEILGHLAPKAGFKIAPPVEPEQTTPGRLSPKYGGQTTDQQTEYKQGSTKNPFHGAIARAANLLGEGVEGIARLGEAGGDWMESKIPLSGLTQEQIKNERQLEPLFQFAQSAKNWSKSIGYEPSTQISELTDNPLNAIPFIAERVISSSPDMAAAVAAAPAYWLSRTNEIVNDRLKNDNKTIDQVTMGDVSAAAGAAALEVTLEKFATKHLLKGAPITGKTAIGRMAKEVGFQSLTEGAEEGIGYLGGTVGTEKGVDPKELAMQSLEGAIVGGGLGGAVKGTQEAATKYAEYREKKRQALMAEGVDEDIANQAVDQMDKERAAVQGAAAEVKSGEGLKPNGEPDLDYLEQKFGRQEAPAPTLALPAPEAAAPEVAAPKAAPVVAREEVVAPQVAAELPPVAPVGEERKEVVLQNRDRTTPGSISQMQNIASNPDYKRLGTNTVATVGAPIVFGNVTLDDAQFGNQEEITDERGNRYPVQYAVVDAEDMLASNNADGSPNKDYASFQGIRAIGGNGRLAGLQSAYERGSADKYREELMNDARHGINPEVISEFKNPVLVRLMDPAMVDENTADNFNVAGTQEMDIVSMAKNDTRRVDLERLEFKDSGELTQDAVARFVAAMPVSEQNALIGDNGRPNKKAEARAEAAVFQKAYGNEELTALAFSDTSEEAKNIRRALNDVAPLMMRLEGMGDYDFREQLNEAVMKAITAKRNGLSLDEAARQAAIDEHPLVNHIVQMFADNARSARKISDNLGKLAALSAIEGRPIEDQLFESLITRRSQEELVRAAFEKEVDRLVKVAEKEAEKVVEKKVEEKKPAETKKEEAPKVDKEKEKSVFDDGVKKVVDAFKRHNQSADIHYSEYVSRKKAAFEKIIDNIQNKFEALGYNTREAYDLADDVYLEARAIVSSVAWNDRLQRETDGLLSVERKGLRDYALYENGKEIARGSKDDVHLAVVEKKAEYQQDKDEAKSKKAAEPKSEVNESGFIGASDKAVTDVAEDFAGAMDSQEEGGWQEIHVFDPPTNAEIVRLDEKVRVYHKDHGWMTPAQAKKQIAEWQKNVDKQGSTSVNSDKVVLSLFDLSGEWSKPWAEAGYQVYQFDIQDESTYTDPETGEEKMFGDVNNFSIEFFNDMFGSFDGNDVYAILAACPCTDFASSGARHFAAKDATGQTVESVELVHQTLRTIEYFRPQVWAIENPVGRIEKLTGLPPWRLSFNPNQFGDPYTKRTLLWGRFNADLPVAPVEPTEGSKMHKLYGGKSQATKNARSVTPEGFAYAFFQANNAVDHPVMAIANKFDRLDRDLFQQAVDAGLTFDEMNTAVEEAYYDQDDEQAAQDLVDAIAEKTGEDSSNWSIVLGQSISNAANDTVRKQQISELQSVKQQMSAIERRLAKAELKPTDEAIYKTLYNSSRRLRDDIKYTYQPNKSPAKVLADAAKALANGDIEQEVFDVIDYLYKKNPNVLDGLRLSIRKQKAGTEQMAKGQFNGLARIVRLFKETDGVKDPSTIRHELAHSLEQMMTAEARERVNNVWRDKLLRASKAEKTEAGKKYFENVAKYLVAPSEKTWTDAVSSMPNISYYQYISPSEFWAANAEPLMKARMGGAWEKFKTAVRGMYEGLKNIFGITNKYAVHSVFKQVMDGERLGTEQLDDYFIRTGFKPLFSASKHKNVFGNKPAESSWMSPIIGQYSFNGFMKKYKEYLVNQTPIGKWIDKIVYKLGDKFVDLKRVQKAIGKNLGEAFDAYMRETLYHGRVSAKLEEYMQYEVMPLLDKMVKYGIDKPLLNKFLHARHAEEYNQHINNINPNAAPGMPMHNRGSGMSTEEAQAFMDSLTPEQHRHLTELADKVDDMVRKTQDELVEGQIEKPETIQMWRDSFPFYVPLYRTELDYANTSAGIGRGFSTQSGFGKSATGSLKDVDDILSNITAQRERAVVRSEKGKVARAVYAMAVQNPNSKFWLPVNPRAGVLGKLNKAYAEYQGKLDDLETIQKIIETNQVNGVPESEYHDLIQKERNLRSSVTRSLNAYKKMQFEAKDAMVALRKELSELGLSQQDIVNYIQEPEVPYIDPTTGKVKYKPNTIARNSASVLSVPVDGETRYIFFNPSDASALRMVESLKNLDADKIEGAMKMFNWYTQNIAKLSTQWNLVFGAINFLRDVQGAMLNLTTTPIAGKQKEVFKNIGPALLGIYFEQRNVRKSKKGASEWNKLWKEFQEEGGQTGFRDQFAKTEEQTSRIDRELKKMQQGTPIQKARAVFEWISDANESAENAVRLSAYKVAKAKFLAEGMSEANARARAAEVGKNLTVNFNRKGASTKTANALYAFFNASVQGTARMFQTLTGPKGKMIMGGLVAIGIADALAMAAAGFDEDEPPEFVRQRNLIIPVGGGKYAQIPMPLGFNYFVNFGRIVTELGIHPGKRGIDAVKNLLMLTTESVNPLGQGSLAYQMAPTFADPLVGLYSNKDAFGRPIYKADQATNPLPGYLRAKESASGLATWVSKQINSLTGGTDYRQGMWTPTPDQLEYIAGQLTGGVGREIQRGAKYATGIVEGKPREEVAWHQVPVAGRFFGETTSQSNVSDKFYKNVTELAEYEHEIKGRRKDKKDVQEFLDEHPEAKLWSSANAVENQISQLKQLRKKAKEKGDDARIKKINEQITRVMDQFNRRYKSATQ